MKSPLLLFLLRIATIFIYSHWLKSIYVKENVSFESRHWIKKHFCLYIVVRLMFVWLSACVRAWMLFVTKIVIRFHSLRLYNILIVHYYWVPGNSSSAYYVVVVFLAAVWVRLWSNNDHNQNSFEKDFIKYYKLAFMSDIPFLSLSFQIPN